MVTNDRAASNLGSVAMVKEAPNVVTHEYIVRCFFPLIRSLGFEGALFLNLFSIFFERFSCCCCCFFFVVLFVLFCDLRKKAPLTWKKLINDQILFCEMDKKLRNCLQNINVFMIS